MKEVAKLYFGLQMMLQMKRFLKSGETFLTNDIKLVCEYESF